MFGDEVGHFPDILRVMLNIFVSCKQKHHDTKHIRKLGDPALRIPCCIP